MKTLSWDRDRAHNPALSTEFLLLYTLHTADLRHSSAFVRNHKKTASCNTNSVESTGFFTPGGPVFSMSLCLWSSLVSVSVEFWSAGSVSVAAVLRAVDGLDCRESLRLISESGLVSEDSFNHAVAGLYALLKEALCLPSLRQEVSS